ncbi:MAG: MFS transporter [Bacteroidales bacterium]|nr:MFS transporter [Bacteroidales bacterium]HOY39174.1 MFS transporter [Bacteroidales bacterium]
MKAKGIIKQLPRNFWIANTLELFERWAWYGMFMVLALYLTGSTDTGALGFSQEQKGILMGTVVAILYVLPVITGAIADKYGYKKVLAVAFTILSTGYGFMAWFSNYTLVFMSFIYLAIGAGLFKPVISACIAKTTTPTNSSIGFGIFYMMVNIGAFIGPIFASKLRGIDWYLVFVMSASVILLNLLLLIVFFKEPVRKKNTDALWKSITTIFKNIGTAITDFRFLIFLIIVIGFWTMYNQLFYTLPVFIEQWMDTTSVYQAIQNISPWLASKIGTEQGSIAPEMLTNIDAMYIVLLQVLVSFAVMKLKPLHAMISGFLVSSIGIGLMFMFNNPMYLFFSILIFGLGEMSGSPKISEYVGRIAPREKVALYMGCSFLPMAGGNFFAGLLSGTVYQNMSDKITLLQHEVSARSLDIPAISDTFSQNDYIASACQQMHMNQTELTQYLWNTYHPGNIWIVFSAIGLGTVILLVLYDRIFLKS